MFTCTVGTVAYPIALVHPYDAKMRNRPDERDRELGFYPICERPRKQAEFIAIDSIIRGALLVPDFAQAGYFFVHHLVDGDMFLRIRELQHPPG